MSQYDLVTVMYPNNWGMMPMHMFPVLEQLNFEGKTVCYAPKAAVSEDATLH